MSDNVLTALIGGVVAVIVASVTTLGVWLQRQAPGQAAPKRRKADKEDPLATLLAVMQAEQIRWRDEVRSDLRKDLADAKAEWATERQRYLVEIQALRQENQQLRETVDRQEDEIANLRTQIQTMQDREARRNG